MVAMVVAAAGRRRGAGNLLDHIPVQLWRLVQGGGVGGGVEGRAGSSLHCRGIMNGLLFGGLLCPHLFAIASA